MTHETETGFGSGLRKLLHKQEEIEGEALLEEPVDEYDIVEPEPTAEVVAITEEPEQDGVPLEVLELRTELEAALERERQLKEALEHQVEAYERERANDRDVAVREAEVEQQVARLEQMRADVEEQQLLLKIQRDQIEAERSEVAATRAELVAEEARVTELASHIDSRSAELESADQERAQAGAHLAQQLASLAERERELKRERAAIEQVRQEQEARFLARENALRELDAATLRRQQSVAQHEVELKGREAEV
jgi:chromosome segregation ATPase